MKVEVWNHSKFSHFEEIPDGPTAEEKAERVYQENPLIDMTFDALLEEMDAKGRLLGPADKAAVVGRFKGKLADRMK